MKRPTRVFLHTEMPTRRALASRAERGDEKWVLAGDWLTDEDARTFDGVLELPPPEDVEGTVRRLREAEFDSLVIQTEYGLLPGALIAAERGLPGPTPEAAYACTNKWLCRRILSAAGVPVPRFALASSEQDVRRFAERFPLILKPIASTLGRLVLRVDSAEQIGAASPGLAVGAARCAGRPPLRRFRRARGLRSRVRPHGAISWSRTSRRARRSRPTASCSAIGSTRSARPSRS